MRTVEGGRRDKEAGANAAWVRALTLASSIDARPERIFPAVIEELAVRHGAAPALLSERERFTFEELDRRANRYARWALGQGLAVGDPVALLMPNRPEYLAVWIGLTRVGVVVALLNTNLRGAALAHCVRAAASSHAIVDASLLEAWAGAVPHLDPAPPLHVHGLAGEGGIDEALEKLVDAPLAAEERRPLSTADRALLIYTSGTTGFPKAAHVSHHRVMMWSHWFAGMIATNPGDRMYDCLPLYHSVGGVVATGAPLVGGGSVVIAERFSARGFWDDVVRWDCTLVQYIGELCRYLLHAPSSPNEAQHRVRLACGNGMRGDVWEPFQARFGIPRILEFYAASEGNFSLYNAEGRPGAIGRIPAFMAARFSAAVIRHDTETGLPARGPDGLCIRCAPEEAGEAVGRIAEAAGGSRAERFEGYTSAGDTEAKVLRDVFRPGDAWFRTGDLMRLDRQGWFTFVDRIGDTFRWKGENVSTAEVAEAVAACPGVRDAVVYGVAVPGQDGKAGMAALVPDRHFDPARLHAHLGERLPVYARPPVLRLCNAFEVTETFKLKKGALVAAGFDPALVPDPLLVADAARGTYIPLDATGYADIVAGRRRL